MFLAASDNALTDEQKEKGIKVKGDGERFSSVAYAWMLDRIRPHLGLDEEALQMQLAEIEAVIKAPSDPKSKAWDENQDWLLARIDDSYTAQYKAMGSAVIRTPMQYIKPEVGYTVERVHPSVYFRQKYHHDLNETLVKEKKEKIEVYQLLAMDGWERVYEEHGKYGVGENARERKGWQWRKYKKNWLGQVDKSVVEKWMWEFEIGSLPDQTSVEKWLIDRSWNVQLYFEGVQKGW
ncbi:putative peptidoglycan binding domain containing protein [Fusarium austroafricanum]|uniref:Putative peptidoglycan binding domain containing protein n=1 Tax=Fusarium austroafricanum TaxID=2364996 RepID=A0A8H4NXQ3_9HYPO|nr:putative peptidoglycan binding domain containing protein [Fusarium austroafricanum]